MEDPPRKEPTHRMEQQGPPWLEDWSTEIDWQVKQHGQTLGDHGAGLGDHDQKLAFLYQKVEQIPQGLQEHVLQITQDQRGVVAQVGILKVAVENLQESIPEVIQRPAVGVEGNPP